MKKIKNLKTGHSSLEHQLKLFYTATRLKVAGIAQLVERRIRNA